MYRYGATRPNRYFARVVMAASMLGLVRRLLTTEASSILHSAPESLGSQPASAGSALVVPHQGAEDAQPDDLYRMVEVEVRGNDPAVLRSYASFATMAARELGIKVGECWSPRKAHHERLTLLKSVHIYKKHRVQYEVRTYFRFMQFLQLTGSTSDTFLEYIQRNLPEGVAMKVTKVALEPLPQHLLHTQGNT